jgi:hypothetical protein
MCRTAIAVHIISQSAELVREKSYVLDTWLLYRGELTGL